MKSGQNVSDSQRFPSEPELGALPLVEGGGAKHSPPGQWGTPA